MDVGIRNAALRMQYFEKLVALKNISEDKFIKDLVFERNLTIPNGKTISRIWVKKGNIRMSNRKYWDEIFDFIIKMNECFRTFSFRI